MNNRRRLVLLLGTGACAPRTAFAQRQSNFGASAFWVPRHQHVRQSEALREGLREHGYVEGKNIVIESVGPKALVRERLPGLAVELVNQRAEVIVTGGQVAIRAAKQATATIPIVMGL